MNEVKKYLESGKVDFAEGFALLKKYCDNEGIISLVEKRKNIQYLIFELKRLAKRPHLKPNRGFVDLNRPISDGSSLDKPKVIDDDPKNGDQVSELKSEQDDDQVDDQDDNIVDWHKLKHYQNTKYDNMPNDFCRKIYKENKNLYKELQHNHQQMKLANSDEGRAAFRKEVIRLDEVITSNWKIIDEEIASLDKKDKTEEIPVVEIKESTLRSSITRALKKDNLSNEDLAKLKNNVAIAQQKGLNFSDETNKKLKELGMLD